MKILLLSAALLTGQAAASAEVHVITDRSPGHLKSALARYEKQKGVKVRTLFADKGMIARLQSRPADADVVISKSVLEMENLVKRGLLQPFRTGTVPAEFRHPKDLYTPLSYRARVLFYHPARVRPADLGAMADLADPRWKGRICMRSGYHPYNVWMFSEMAAVRGRQQTAAFMGGLQRNLARRPAGNDRAQVRGVAEGHCDVAIANSYYMGIMLGREDQKKWGMATRVFFPDQKEGGTAVMISAAGLTTAGARKPAAGALLTWLAGPEAAAIFRKQLFVYSPTHGVKPRGINATLGEGQPGVRGGVFKKRVTPPQKIAAARNFVLQELDRLKFDRVSPHKAARTRLAP